MYAFEYGSLPQSNYNLLLPQLRFHAILLRFLVLGKCCKGFVIIA